MKLSRTKIASLIPKFIVFIVVVVLCAAVIFGLSLLMKTKKTALAEQQAKENVVDRAPTNVAILNVSLETLQEKISLPGIVKPWIVLDVVAEVKGQVIEKKVTEGRSIKKGEVLALIDRRDYQNAYDAALASYETALATEKTDPGPFPEKFCDRRPAR